MLQHLWRLTRGEHGVLAALASSSSYVIAGGRDALAIALVVASTFLAEACLFAHNDLCNLAEDRINRPGAPLVTGAISIRAARVVAYSSLAAGALASLLLGLALGPAPPLVYAAAVALGILYNSRLKRIPVAGSLAVSIITSMTYIYGMACAGALAPALLLLFASSLLAALGREFVKAALDYEGDLRAGVRTIAAVIGPRRSVLLGAALTLSSTALGWILVLVALDARLAALAAGAAATNVALTILSVEAIRGRLEAYRTGTLVAFGATLIALAAEAAWRLF
ncbi:MAG: UbiA family prenyltransferase [Thermoproteaceae archaeon]|nr:UbiA family prenyltransferase [Thermoproteaceae archaeon]